MVWPGQHRPSAPEAQMEERCPPKAEDPSSSLGRCMCLKQKWSMHRAVVPRISEFKSRQTPHLPRPLPSGVARAGALAGSWLARIGQSPNGGKPGAASHHGAEVLVEGRLVVCQERASSNLVGFAISGRTHLWRGSEFLPRECRVRIPGGSSLPPTGGVMRRRKQARSTHTGS